jgi:4-carboxymuconolactone decarboxylase
MPRVTPITGKADVPAAHHGVVDQVVKVFGGVRGPFSMLLHSPPLAERLLPLVTFFRDESSVEGKLRSVAILAAVREREAAYVWSAQTGARRNVMSTIDAAPGDAATPSGLSATSWSTFASSCTNRWSRRLTPFGGTIPGGWSR